MHWNHRIIKLTRNVDEPRYGIFKVFYNDDSSLSGYADANFIFDSVADLTITVSHYMTQALMKPTLDEEDFYK